jgi:Ca2+:H+ antiporter
VAVTVIEVALLASIILQPDSSPTLVRDTVFAVVMIVCNGLVGLCVLVGGLRYREQGFLVSGASVYLTVLLVLATLSLVLPNYTRAVPGPVYSTNQLLFASVATLVLYGVFLYIQTVRHKDYFVPVVAKVAGASAQPAVPPSIMVASVLLVAALTGIVLLAKKISVVIGTATAAIGAPPAFVGVIVAAIVLLPESVSALRAARNDELQKSINLALGSSLATIGLTIPIVALVNILLDKSLMLGLDQQSLALLLLTMLVSTQTFGTGRTNILFGVVHLVIFTLYLFLLFEP